MSGPTVLDLTVRPGDHVEVRVNGRTVALVAAGAVDTRDDLMAQVGRANALRALPQVLTGLVRRLASLKNLGDEGKAPAVKVHAYARGVSDGLAGRTVPHPTEGDKVPPIRPAHGPSYEAGYEWGLGVRGCLEAASVPASKPARVRARVRE